MKKDTEIVSLTSNADLDVGQQTILDLFRITAAIFVLLGHSFSLYHCTIFKDQTYFPYLQNIGVVMFFLLSGFLTVYSLEKHNMNHQYSFSRFFQHKAYRIAKEYYPGLLIIAIIDAISISMNGSLYEYLQEFSVKEFIGNALMLQNMGPAGILGRFFTTFGSGRPLWTLAIEWWFYMLLGSLYFSLRNREKVSLSKMLLLGLFLLMSSAYIIAGRGGGLGFVFALGVLSYYIYKLISRKTAKFLFACSFMLYILYGLAFKEAYTVYSFIILWLIFTSSIRMGSNSVCQKRKSVLSFVSKSTFMLYLVHYSVIYFLVISNISWCYQAKFWVGIICSVLLSLVGHYVFGDLLCYKIKRNEKREQ